MTILIGIIFLLGMIVYFFSIGCREYFTFFLAQRRTNPLIYLDKDKDISKGLLGYHMWRLIEYAIFIIISVKAFGFMGFLACVWGNYLVYERVWDYLKYKVYFKRQTVKYWLNGKEFVWDSIYELIFGIITLILTIYLIVT